MKQLLFVLFFSISFLGFSQLSGLKNGINSSGLSSGSSASNGEEVTVKLSGKTKYTDYKIISFKNDTTFVDTTLTIKKEYKFNFRRKDNFELLEFHNQGQTFNNLAYDYTNLYTLPDIGYRAKQFLYMNFDAIDYYEVPTPTSEILYRTGLQQGQVLDALFTVNFSKRLNMSIAYKGLRSLGWYRRSLASTGNFRTTVSYKTPKDQYNIRAHITFQDFWNQESGGIQDEFIQSFIDNVEEIEDRELVEIKLDDTENKLKGTRIYIDHNYKLFSSKDSTNLKDFSNLKVGHILHSEKKDYDFTQGTATTDYFGDSYETGSLTNKNNFSITNNQAYLEFNSKYILGQFKAKVNHTKLEYGFNSIYNPTVAITKTKLTGNAISAGAEWKGKIGNFYVNGDATITPGQGHLAGNLLKGEAFYKKDSVLTVKGSLLISSKTPNLNFQLMHSSYENYNWSNNFDNINTRNLGFDLTSKWGNASANFTNIENFTYFDTSSQAQQYDGSLIYLKLKLNKEFKVGKFALDNTIMYQNVSSGSEVFRVPDFVTRNTLYYADHWFKEDPLQVQIGATFKYFTKYNANAYDPFLAEFRLQNDTEIGYPMVDVFFNARVRRTRIYFKADNIMSNFTTTKNYFSAPNYPYRDFVIRFGVVWNWFI